MGGDGGQVIDRATMVKTKGWGLTNNRSGSVYSASLGEMANYVQFISEDRGLGFMELHRTRMCQCFLSQADLSGLDGAVVACRLGNLYNKEAMIGAFLNKQIPASMSHIKKLSDLKNCKIAWKEAENKEQQPFRVGTTNQQQDNSRHMICPISMEELDSGGSRAVVIWATGVVLGLKSLKAMKTKKGEVQKCPVTGQPFDFDKDVITLAPDVEELAKLRERLPVVPASKKRKAESSGATASTAEAATASGGAEKAAHSGRIFSGGVEKASAKRVLDKSATKSFIEEKPLEPLSTDGGDDGAAFYRNLPSNQRVDGKVPAKAQKKLEGSEVFKSMFCSDREAMSGPRDAFGKPIYNRGSRCL